MTPADRSASPARHAPAILGCAAVLLAAGAGLGTTLTLSAGAADGGVLDRLQAPPARPAAPAPAAPRDAEAVTAAILRGGSLYDSAVAAGASPGVVTQAAALFSRKLDLARDLQPGAAFRLVAERSAGTEALLYAEVAAGGRVLRFYRFAHDGASDYLDEAGRAPKPLLLRTPVDGARVTSGFGMRLHPLLGFNRLHPGVDFGAPQGSPVLAAGDGVVEEAKWAGGYGHWLKLGHAQGFETGYGHLLRYAPGVRPGAAVRQGQVVAYVGSTGLSTGPHLHYEIMRRGEKLDPATAPVPADATLDPARAAAFAAQKARIDRLLAGGAERLGRAAPSPGSGSFVG